MGGFLVGMWLQDSGLSSSGDTRLLMIFVGLVALAMLIQAFVVLALGIVAIKAQKKLLTVIDELKVKAMPIIATVQDVARDTAPKVKVVTENIVETSQMVRSKIHDFEETLATANEKFKEATETFADANQRTRGQVARVDGMITSALKATADLGATIHHSIQVPAKQVAGVVTGLKTGLDVLLSQASNYAGYRKRTRP